MNGKIWYYLFCLLRHLLREVFGVAGKEGGHIVRDEVDFSFDGFRLAWLQSTDTEVGVEASGHALEEFLMRLKGDGKELFFIAAEAADEPIARHERTEWARIYVGAGNILRAPYLAGNIAGFFAPRFDFVHPHELAVEKEEALGQVVVEVLASVIVAGEVAEADTRLRPVRNGGGRGWIVRGDGKSDVIGAGRDGVVDDDSVFYRTAQFYRFPVIAEGDEFRGVADGCVMPVGSGGVGAAIRFEVVDANLSLRQMRTLDDEPILVSGQGKAGVLRRGEADDEREKCEDGFHGG